MQQFIARYRIGISRAWFLLVLILILLTRHSWPDPGLVTQATGALGFVFITIAAFGRLWSSIYICGYKNQRVIQDGPYSIVRNPLYVFSLFGAVGIGLITHSVTITALIVLFFVWIYPITVGNEERKLEEMLGQDYLDYKARTPRFIPAFAQFSNVEQYTINMPQLQNAFLDALWFFLGYGLLQGVDSLQSAGVLPVIGLLP